MDVVTTGAIVAGRYRLDHRLGAGATATVWRAEDGMFDRPVAVKLVDISSTANPTANRERLRREARAAARLHHRNITRVLDYGEAPMPDGTVQPFLVMELLTGQSLADRLAELETLPWREASDVCSQIAAGLEVAHAAGIVHRDIKPANIFLTDEAVKVLDFGIAATAWDPSMTRTGQVVGTPWYLAPERLVGKESGPASDIYSLGCMLHHLLTGEPPFIGRNFTAIAESHMHSPMPELEIAGLPAAIVEVHHACLARDPARRPNAAQVSRRLREVLDGDGDAPLSYEQSPPPAVSTVTVSQGPDVETRAVPDVVPRPPRPPRRVRTPVILVAVAALAAAVALGAWAMSTGGGGGDNGGPRSDVSASPGFSANPVAAPPRSAMALVRLLRSRVTHGESSGTMSASAATTLLADIDALSKTLANHDTAATATTASRAEEGQQITKLANATVNLRNQGSLTAGEAQRINAACARLRGLLHTSTFQSVS